MANLVQKFIVEDASKASPILPQHVCFVTADGEPAGISKQAANPGANPTIAKVVKCLVDAGMMADRLPGLWPYCRRECREAG